MVNTKFLLFPHSFPGCSAFDSVFSVHLFLFPILNLVMTRTAHSVISNVWLLPWMRGVSSIDCPECSDFILSHGSYHGEGRGNLLHLAALCASFYHHNGQMLWGHSFIPLSPFPPELLQSRGMSAYLSMPHLLGHHPWDWGFQRLARWEAGREGSQSQQMRQQHVLSLKGDAGQTGDGRVMSEWDTKWVRQESGCTV